MLLAHVFDFNAAATLTILNKNVRLRMRREQCLILETDKSPNNVSKTAVLQQQPYFRGNLFIRLPTSIKCDMWLSIIFKQPSRLRVRSVIILPTALAIWHATVIRDRF